jgi:hypothetical protein
MSLELSFKTGVGKGPVIKTMGPPIFSETTVTLNGAVDISLEDFLALVRIVFDHPYGGVEAEQLDEFIKRLCALTVLAGHNIRQDPFCTRLGLADHANFWYQFPFGDTDHQDDSNVLALVGTELCMLDFLSAVHYVFTNTDIEPRDLRPPFLEELRRKRK